MRVPSHTNIIILSFCRPRTHSRSRSLSPLLFSPAVQSTMTANNDTVTQFWVSDSSGSINLCVFNDDAQKVRIIKRSLLFFSFGRERVVSVWIFSCIPPPDNPPLLPPHPPPSRPLFFLLMPPPSFAFCTTFTANRYVQETC